MKRTAEAQAATVADNHRYVEWEREAKAAARAKRTKKPAHVKGGRK